jgi:hypothetical protein
MSRELTLADFHPNIQKGFIDSDLEKGTYANNAQNRKMGRVGQSFGGGKEKDESKKEDNASVKEIISSVITDLDKIKSDYSKSNKSVSFDHYLTQSAISKLTVKAFKTFAASPKQKKIVSQIDSLKAYLKN